MTRIAVVGAGYVGLVTAGCLAKLGHAVVCVDVDVEKVAAIGENRLPIVEPGLASLWRRYQGKGTLRVTTSYGEALQGAGFVFLCVGTPGERDGVNLEQVAAAVAGIIGHLPQSDPPVLVVKSTVPPGTAEHVARLLVEAGTGSISVVSNPEFLSEGRAVQDFLKPARVIIGSSDRSGAARVGALYEPLRAPTVYCQPATAELIKYASNAFLATKISFINELAELCDAYHVDVTEVAQALGLDPNIGPDYLGAGLGWGGSCLPKDVAALSAMAAAQGTSNRLLSAVARVNDRQPRLLVGKLRQRLAGLEGRTIAVLGLTFKPDCDDIRESPALRLVRVLLRQGCRVNAYDPVAMPAVARAMRGIALCADPYAAAEGADAVVIATAWAEFERLDFEQLRRAVRNPLIVDGRNCLPPDVVREAGFSYSGIGPDADRGAPEPQFRTAIAVDGSSGGSRICVVGAGWVGLTVAACLAKLGHTVTAVDVDVERVAAITNSRLPIVEPGLASLWRRYQRLGTLRVTTSYGEALRGARFVFLCVGTPSEREGGVNLDQLKAAVGAISDHVPPDESPVLVIKSTVPPGTGEHVAGLLEANGAASIRVVSNPEFLREGHAVHDFLTPLCVVIGAADPGASARVAGLYEPLRAPTVFCQPATAELIKYASNAFLATKISFINEVAELCDAYHVDVTEVAQALGLDPRIRPGYLGAGLGWGGSCLPKDVAALGSMAAAKSTSNRLLTAVQSVNDRQPRLLAGKLRQRLGMLEGRSVAVLGLTFKPDCDDIRESPALRLVRVLLRQGCRVSAYDPVAMPAVARVMRGITLSADPYAAAEGADAVVIATAWAEFENLDFERLRRAVRNPLVVDGRNCLSSQALREAGFSYAGVGRGHPERNAIARSHLTLVGSGAGDASDARPPAGSAIRDAIRIALR